MSYILEALKKADAERERGAVPDLHAQPIPLAVAYEEEAPRGTKPWLWLLAGAAIAIVAVLAWQFSGSDAPPGIGPALPAAPAEVLAPPPPAPITQPAASTQQAAEPAPAPARPAIQSEPPAKAAPRIRVEPRAPAVAASAAVAVAAGAAPSATPSATSSAAAKAAKGASAPPAATRAPLLTELPEDIRRQVPAMTIGGSVYSQQPANRMVIINGQVFREGSAVTPDLRLEQIGPKSAVFSLGGQRFEMPF